MIGNSDVLYKRGTQYCGKSPYDAAKSAAEYVLDCIRTTQTLDNHWYGAAFEPVLGNLIKALQE